MNLAPVFPLPYGVFLFDGLPLDQRSEDLGLLVVTVGRNQHRDGFSDNLIGSVAEHATSPFVPARDDAIERLADDRVTRRLYDGRQSEAMLVRLVPFADVADGG